MVKDSFYREELLYITNRGALYRLDKCCKTLNIILTKPQLASYYFNTNDLNLLMDVMLREVVSNPDSKTRIQIYKLIETVLNNEIYREYKYRYEDVEQVIRENIMDDEGDNKFSDAERECIASLNTFFQIEKSKGN